VAHAQADAQRHVAAERATLDRTVRQLIALAHPDRWPDTPLAHELTVALVALRKTRIALNVENLLDKRYFPTVDGDNNISPGAPRTVRVTLSMGF